VKPNSRGQIFGVCMHRASFSTVIAAVLLYLVTIPSLTMFSHDDTDILNVNRK
jgi:hypothetical protein